MDAALQAAKCELAWQSASAVVCESSGETLPAWGGGSEGDALFSNEAVDEALQAAD
jgi:hypothetical protein